MRHTHAAWGKLIFVQRDPLSEARTTLLRTPDSGLLADYWLATDVPGDAAKIASLEMVKPLLDVMPRRVVREAEEIAKRHRLADENAPEAARKRIEVRFSLRTRASAKLSLVVAAALKAPWGVMTVVATWFFIHTCHQPRIEVLTCAWYLNQELTQDDSVALRDKLSRLWISRFAIDTLQTLP